MKQETITASAPIPAGAYSQGIRANGFLYTAGQGPMNPETLTVPAGGIREQTAQTMENVRAILAANGLGFEHVVKATVHLQELSRDFSGFDAVYREYLEPPFPVRTTVGSQLANILVEIDVVAAFPE